MANQIKLIFISLLLAAGLVGIGSLFSKDFSKTPVASASKNENKITTAPQSTNLQQILGSYNSKNLGKSELTSGELQKIYDAEIQVYSTVEQILTERYIKDFFEEYKKSKNLPSIEAAQVEYFKTKAVVNENEAKLILEKNKDNPNLQRIPEKDRLAQVKQFLENRARQSALNNLGEEAKQRGQVQISMPRPIEPRAEVSGGNNYFIGDSKAKVTIVEFADYQCPFCANGVEVRNAVLKKFGNKVKWFYRDFPLRDIHPEALPAAIAANCGGAQEKYFEFNTAFFKNQKSLGREFYLKTARDLKLDMPKYEKCLSDAQQEKEVIQDFEDGVTVGVKGTPSYFINGRRASLSSSEDFIKIIEEEIKSSEK